MSPFPKLLSVEFYTSGYTDDRPYLFHEQNRSVHPPAFPPFRGSVEPLGTGRYACARMGGRDGRRRSARFHCHFRLCFLGRQDPIGLEIFKLVLVLVPNEN